MGKSRGRVKASEQNLTKLIRLGNRMVIVSVGVGIVVVPITAAYGIGKTVALAEKTNTDYLITPEQSQADILSQDFVTSRDVYPNSDTLITNKKPLTVEFSNDALNDFLHDANYKEGDTINVAEDCDFSQLAILLNAGDMSADTKIILDNTKEEFDKLGIDCTVVDYYSEAVDFAEEKATSGKNVCAITLEGGKNKTNGVLVATNYKTTLTSSGEKSTSGDVFAMAIANNLSGSYVAVGVGSDIVEGERVAPPLEKAAIARNLYIKNVVIRTQNGDPRFNDLPNAIVNGVIKASTCNANVEYISPEGTLIRPQPISLTKSVAIDKGRVTRL